MTCFDAVRLVDAYVDDEMGAVERSQFLAHVDRCARCGRAVDRRVALQGAVRGLPYHAAPDRLRAAVIARTRAAGRPRRFALAAAAIIVLAVGAGSAVRMMQARAAAAALSSSLVADHVRALRASHVIDVQSSDRHTVKPWFLGKIDYAPPVDDLSAAGFPLAGGRLATIDGRTVAVLVYQRRLHPIAVYVWPEADTRARAAGVEAVRGFNVRHWTVNGMSFWAVTDANAADLDALELSNRQAAVR
jgi:anti-sigma factor RsiW